MGDRFEMRDCEVSLHDTLVQTSDLPDFEEKQPVRCQQDIGIPGLQPMSVAMLVRAHLKLSTKR